MGAPPLSAHQVDAVDSPSGAPVSAPPNSRGSRAGLLAELEADSFLAELAQEQDHGENSQPAKTSFPSLDDLLSKFVLPVRSGSGSIASDEASNELQAGETSSGKGALDVNEHQLEPTQDEREDTALFGNLDDPSSPVTPRSPPAIELYITPKSLYSPSYDIKILALFQHNPNVWIRKGTRPTAFDMWCTPEDRMNEQYRAVDEELADDMQPEQTPSLVHSPGA